MMAAEKALTSLKDAGIRLNKNNLLKLDRLIKTLARREGVTPDTIVGRKNIAVLLADRKMNGPQKIKKLIDLLTTEAFPSATSAETAFLKGLKKLDLHPKIHVTHTPFFEDSRIGVAFSYSDPDELEEIMRSLKRLKEHDLIAYALEAAEDTD